MKLREALANNNYRNVKIASVASLVAAALIWTIGTDNGAFSFSQSGSRDSSEAGLTDRMARTKDAAARALQETGDALSSFMGRSPGERGVTDILKGKTKRLAQRGGKPSGRARPKQRALGKVFDNPSQDIAGGLAPQPLADLLVAAGQIGDAVPALNLIAANPDIFTPIGGGFAGGPSFGGGPGFGGGFVGGIGGGAVPPAIVPPVVGLPVVPPVASAVPEPSTWLLLLFGFSAIGASLRRNKAPSRRTGHCEAI